ncbi:MAG: aldo/keto reductase [Caldilineae bacterium]|nr:MAG: aldo/keto reductase [Caldilineae bacterium]
MNHLLPEDRIYLGQSDIQISALGVGAWAWGDRMFWGYGKGGFSDADIEAAFKASLDAGVNFVDTAEMYGRGRSEQLIGQMLPRMERPVVVATKFFPWPYRLTRGRLLAALRKSLERLRLQQVDLYQIHWPFPPVPIETWMQALADAVEQGLTRTVGVSNYNLQQTKRAQAALAARGIPLASNQVQYSLLMRKPEREGLLDYCREHRITLIAYSPLGQGVLTGKYSADNPPPGLRGRRYNRSYLERVSPLLELLREIASAHHCTPAQVALNWVICKGAVPIPGAKNERQAIDNAGALGWRLSKEEVQALDRASDRI